MTKVLEEVRFGKANERKRDGSQEELLQLLPVNFYGARGKAF